jgi:hypothetical protein
MLKKEKVYNRSIRKIREIASKNAGIFYAGCISIFRYFLPNPRLDLAAIRVFIYLNLSDLNEPSGQI